VIGVIKQKRGEIWFYRGKSGVKRGRQGIAERSKDIKVSSGNILLYVKYGE